MSSTNTPKKVATKSNLKPSSMRVGDAGGDVLDEWMKGKQLLRHEDMLDLPDAELKEEVGRFLLSTDTNAPNHPVEYSYAQDDWVPLPTPPPTVILVHLEGCAILKESPEAQAQIEAGDWCGEEEEEGHKKAVKRKVSEDEDEEDEGPAAAAEGGEEGEEGEDIEGEAEAEAEDAEGGEGEAEDQEMEGEGEDEEGGVEDIEGVPEDEEGAGPVRKKVKKLPNAFNFCEQAALTYNNPYREMFTQTIPLPRFQFCGVIGASMIYDCYAEDFARQEREREKEIKKPPGQKKEAISSKKLAAMLAHAIQMKTYEAAKTLDRMICQNLFDDISQDYRYYEDPSDDYRVGFEGTLLPLWKFCYEKTKKNTVTDIAWNPKYYDLFAVTMGCYDYAKQPVSGALCLFTLKNPSFPECVIPMTDCPLTLAIHDEHAYLHAVGYFSGNLEIFNSTLTEKTPQFVSDPLHDKHKAPISQIKYGSNMVDGELNIYSISADGCVKNWILMQNTLACTTIIELTLPIEAVPGPDGAMTPVRAGGTAIAFHPTNPNVFLAGTEEGKVFKCSTLYSYKYMFTYEAHTMPVHKLTYNRYVPDIFASGSGDWTVKIWEDCRSAPLFCFDLGMAVGDVQWAPYSSTVLGAITTDGKCHVFDLNLNKYKAVCCQNVVTRKNKNRSQRIRFNYKMPILVVGDERGTITTLKLSPNLRIKPKQAKKKDAAVLEPRQLEMLKIEKILDTVREPVVLPFPPDCVSVVEK